jgi:uncharacterized protein
MRFRVSGCAEILFRNRKSAISTRKGEVSRMREQDKGGMSVSDAGKKGGERTSETHGHEFYEEIGKKGGHKGGESTAERYGHEFYEEIGHKGGQTVRKLVEEGKKAEGE